MGKICAFFGHRDLIITYDIEDKLEKAAENLIQMGYSEFWCCEQGTFDWVARTTVIKLKKRYNNLYLCYVCAYNPDKFSKIRMENLSETFELIYTSEIADGPPRFAIERRNKYIADNVDAIICYIKHKSGGAYKAVLRAKKQGKQIINLYGMEI